MRILALVTDAYGSRGGMAKFNRDMLDALCGMTHCDEVLVLPRTLHEAVGAIPDRLRFDTRSLGGKHRYARHLVRALPTMGRIDAVICGHVRLLPLGWLAARVKQAPLVLVVHGVEAWQPQDSAITNRLVRSVDAFVTVSEHTRARFVAWAHPRTRRAYVVPNTIDPTRFGAGPKPERLLDRYGLRGRTVLLTVSRLSAEERYKGHDEIIELLPRLASDVPDIAYLIVGEGDDKPRLQGKAAALGLAERVVFAGHVPEVEKADHYRLADAFVMPGRGEGFGIVYLEAAACGIPVVASSADASREAVVDGALGEIADPADPESIRRAVLAALARGRGTVPDELEQFSMARFATRWEHLMTEVVSDDAGSRRGRAARVA